jgi:hypothetical protein
MRLVRSILTSEFKRDSRSRMEFARGPAFFPKDYVDSRYRLFLACLSGLVGRELELIQCHQ